jgi:hypothetical protein
MSCRQIVYGKMNDIILKPVGRALLAFLFFGLSISINATAQPLPKI